MAYEKICVCLLLVLGLSTCLAVVHRVGDDEGWNSQVTDYKKWAKSKQFQVGDTIVFNYDPQFHDVREVRKEEFHACSSDSSIATYATGHDAVLLSTPGSHYYICSRGRMCQQGQKLHVRIESKNKTPSPPNNTSAPPCTTNSTTPVVPGRAHNSSSSIFPCNSCLGLLVIFASSMLVFWFH